MSTPCSTQLIKGAWIADGTGAPLFRSSVLIRDGVICGVESSISESAADRVIRLNGEILSPGFLDAHGHSDLSALARPECFSKVSQGVCAEIIGNCGLSAFPVTRLNKAHLQELYRDYGVEITWQDFAGYRAEAKRRGVRLKLHALCGHNTLRAAVAGYEERELSGQALDEMGRILRTMLSQGARGLSTGLLYVPGKFADRDELVFLMKILQENDALYATHLRSEGVRLLESLDETIDCARSAGLKRLQISHFKTAGAANWGKLDAALARFEAARSEGMALHCDRYPYTESMTQLSAILPDGWDDLDDQTLETRLQSPENALSLETALTEARPAEYWKTVRLVRTNAPDGRGVAGDTFDRIAERRHITPQALTVKLLAADAPGTTAAFRGMSPENLRRILAEPFCCCGSDENARPLDESIGRSHPRGFGSLPRFLKMRLESGSSIEAAVHQVTGLPVSIFGLKDAGKIAVGSAADLTAFDPENLDGGNDFRAPHTPASGICFTMIDGKIVYTP